MAQIETHAPGSFCWIELGTTDQNAAKQFYQSLFGWTSNDFPMGPNEVYTMFQLESKDSGATYTLKPEVLQRGVPPHWALYVAVTSADEAVAKATAAGGKIIAGPFDVFTFGRMAVIQDPTGALFQVWEPKTHKGTGITGVPGTLCWADLSTPDVDTAAKFYSDVFGWTVEAGTDGSGYLHIKNGEEFIGGIPPATHHNANVPPHWLLYFLTDDTDVSAKKATDMGAKLLMGPMSMEGVGRMAIVADPQGAVFALFKSARQS